MSCRNILVILFLLSFSGSVVCQAPRKNFNPDSLPESYFTELKKEYRNKKQYPPQFEKQILIALSYYPELKSTSINIRTRARHSPGSTRAAWAGLFETKEKRHFVITISDSTEPMLMPLLFKNLSFNTQVALIGHELAHVADFSTKTTFGFLKHAVSNVSAKYVDRFEYNTDAICIAHGLGYQLLEWSSYVRMKMNTVNWDGPDYAHRPKKRERYMNPATILKRINEDPLYRVIRSH
jgi:hypothetical protein